MYCAHATAQCEGTRTNGTYDICTLSYKYTHILISCYFFHFSGLILKKCIISLLTGPCFLPTPLLMRSWDQERYEIAIMSKWFICLDLIMSNIKITTYSHSQNIILTMLFRVRVLIALLFVCPKCYNKCYNGTTLLVEILYMNFVCPRNLLCRVLFVIFNFFTYI